MRTLSRAANSGLLDACLNFDVLLQNTFSNPSVPLGILTTDPEKVLALAMTLGGRRNNETATSTTTPATPLNVHLES